MAQFPSNTSASGVWTLKKQGRAQRGLNWPDMTIPPGQIAYTLPGTYTWVAPAGVTSVCVVCVGGAGSANNTNWSSGGAGGGLGWKNNIPVTPGQSYTVVVGAAGTSSGTYDALTTTHGADSYFSATTVVRGLGGKTAIYPFSSGGEAPAGGTYVGDGGGTGGAGGRYDSSYVGYYGGGGGAGGYSGNGGMGASNSSAQTYYFTGQSGSGGGGGGGGTNDGASTGGGGGGGGVGLLGQGTSGSAGSGAQSPGQGGSGGAAASTKQGGLYGGGTANVAPGTGSGAVRIIWGVGRSFPSTNTGNL